MFSPAFELRRVNSLPANSYRRRKDPVHRRLASLFELPPSPELLAEPGSVSSSRDITNSPVLATSALVMEPATITTSPTMEQSTLSNFPLVIEPSFPSSFVIPGDSEDDSAPMTLVQLRNQLLAAVQRDERIIAEQLRPITDWETSDGLAVDEAVSESYADDEVGSTYTSETEVLVCYTVCCPSESESEESAGCYAVLDVESVCNRAREREESAYYASSGSDYNGEIVLDQGEYDGDVEDERGGQGDWQGWHRGTREVLDELCSIDPIAIGEHITVEEPVVIGKALLDVPVAADESATVSTVINDHFRAQVEEGIATEEPASNNAAATSEDITTDEPTATNEP
ncbi:hypothetical protein CspHIS471_0109150 [Cutaneotrichosporon sp. HIS471]|nr:hypothetical protein CspHIS471_0109150 [Cutaneotrichosporon sp. HIS471]